MTAFGSIFSKSPFIPLQEHWLQAIETVSLLKTFFEAWFLKDELQLEEYRTQLIQTEARANQIKTKLQSQLSQRVLIPIARNDVFNLLELQSDLAIVAKEIVETLTLRKMSLPEIIQDDLMRFVENVEKVCLSGHEMGLGVGNLVQSGFGTQASQKLLEMVDHLPESQTQITQLEARLHGKLFQIEKQMQPVDVIFWYEIFKSLGSLANSTNKIGNHLRLMTVSS